MAKIYLLVGIPASGKTTATEDLVKQGAVVLSSDKIREELFGDEDIQFEEEWLKEQGYDGIDNSLKKQIFANGIIFDMVYKRLDSLLEEGKDVILDSTNVTKRNRRNCFDLVTATPDEVNALVIATPFDVCVERNEARSRTVPYNAMQRIANSYEEPTYDEGFDNITFFKDKNDIDYGIAYFLDKYDSSKLEDALNREEIISFVNSIDLSEHQEEDYLEILFKISPVFRLMYDFDLDPEYHDYQLIHDTLKCTSELTTPNDSPESLTYAKIYKLFLNTGKMHFKRYMTDKYGEEAFDKEGLRLWDFYGFSRASMNIMNRVLENAGFSELEIQTIDGFQNEETN